MEYRTLGRTGLSVSVMGIGGGGPSRLGMYDNVRTESESIDILLRSFDAGINFIDTAEGYGTEDIVGKAVAQRDRESLIISTKKSTRKEHFNPEGTIKSLEDSLKRLQTDYVDVYHIHGLKAADYDYCMNEIVPVLHTLQTQGKIRHIGVTEAWNSDLEHDMLQLAVADDVWDVFMVGFNVLNQSARKTVLLPSIEKNIGILIMFAVRRSLSRPEKYQETIKQLIEQGEVNVDGADPYKIFDDLIAQEHGESMTDIAYRFCREEAGTHVILSGTSNPAHLDANIETFNRPILSADVIEQFKSMFGQVTSTSAE